MNKLRVYPPEACWDFMESTADKLGWLFSYQARFDWMVKGEPFSATDAATILQDLDTRFPLAFMRDVLVFILPGQLRTYNPASIYGWGEAAYHGRAYPSHIIIGAKLKENLASTLTHEVGHALTYCLVDSIYEDHINSPKLEEYRLLRALDPYKYGYGENWDERIFEVFAEDYRWLFGSPDAHAAPFTPYKDGEPAPPSENIRRWMLALIESLPSSPPIEIEIVGENSATPEPGPQPLHFDIYVGRSEGGWKTQTFWGSREGAIRNATRLAETVIKGGATVRRIGF